eukprot:2675618-Lingulodinium_polyedra.AAC.1
MHARGRACVRARPCVEHRPHSTAAFAAPRVLSSSAAAPKQDNTELLVDLCACVRWVQVNLVTLMARDSQ